MTMLKTGVACVTIALAMTLGGVPIAAQNATPETVEQARQRAREEAQRAREAAERARDAARQVREQEAQLRRTNRNATRDAERGPEFTEPFTRTIRIGRAGTFELSNVSGDIVITGGNGEDVKIDAIKRVRQPTEQEARALLKEIQILVTDRSNQVEVRTEYPQRRRNWSGGVDYTVTLPVGTTVTVRSVSGDVRVTNVRGDLRADTVSGDVIASSLGRLRGARSVSGDVQLTDIQAEDVVAGTVSGDVTARNLKVRALDLQAVSGDLRFVDVESERANVQTISGDIEYAGRLARSGRYQFQTQSGDIRLTPTSDTGFDLEATSFSGNIRSDFSFRNNATVETPQRGPRTQSLRGTVGDASAVITLRSFSGDVTVLRSQVAR